MQIAIYLPLLSAALVGITARWLAHRLPPETASKVLTWAAVVTALSCAFTLAVLAFLLVARTPTAGALGHWSASTVQAGDRVPLAVSAAGAMATLLVTGLLVTVVWRQVRAAVHARDHCSRIGGEPGRLVVLESERADAYAVSADRGRIVVTRPMLQALSGPERRALLAHERAHLEQHHHCYRTAVAVASALCPLLLPTRHAIEYATERWADETAADELASRTLVATTLARASVLAGADPRRRPSFALAAAGGPVVRRVQALLLPVPRQRPLLVTAVVAMTAVALLGALDVRSETEHLLEVAGTAWTATS